jgi:hypothetical protein
MAFEYTCRRELSQFVTDHILGNEYRKKFLPVVYIEGVTNHLREYGRPAGPCFDNLLFVLLVEPHHFLVQLFIDERTLFD